MIHTAYFKSPIGDLKIETSKERLLSVKFKEEDELIIDIKESGTKVLNETIKQLDEYFSGKRTKFDLPIDLSGTEFQKGVLNAVERIPFGETNSYKEIAERIGNGKASRAIGNANNKNKVLIVVPCHRVIGSNGSLIGYAAGIWRKEWLLNFEKGSGK